LLDKGTLDITECGLHLLKLSVCWIEANRTTGDFSTAKSLELVVDLPKHWAMIPSLNFGRDQWLAVCV